MKVVSSFEKITVYLCIKEISDVNEFIKKLLTKLKNKYKIKLSGFYQINIYKNNKSCYIIDIIKEEDSSYFNDLMDLKINVFEDSSIYLCFDDYFWNTKRNVEMFDNKYYININNISEKDFLSFIEFGRYVYGEDINTIKSKLHYLTK